MPPLLARSGNVVPIVFGVSVVIGLFVVLFLVWTWSKRRFLDDASGHDEPWTLQDLRDLRAANRISEQEFQVLRAQMVGSLKDGDQSAESNQDIGGN